MTLISSMSVWAKLSRVPRRRPFLTAAFVLVAAVVLLLAGVLVALQTRSGRDALARAIEQRLSDPAGLAVDIGRIDGRLPHQILIDRLAISDARSEWLTAEDVRLDWRPLALFRGTVVIDSLRVGRLSVSRLPTASETAGEADAPVNLPPLELTLDLLTVETAMLGEAVLGMAVALRADGSLAISKETLEVALSVARTDDVEGRLDLALAYDAKGQILDLEGSLAEPQGGLLARLAAIPGLPAVALSVSGEGPAGSWAGEVVGELESLLSVDLAVDIDLREGFRSRIDGSLRPGPQLGGPAMAALGRDTTLSIDVRRPRGSDEIRLGVDRLVSDTVAASGTASVTWTDKHLRGEAEIDIVDPVPFAALLAPAELASISAKLSFDGPLDHPTVRLHAMADRVTVRPVRAQTMNVAVEITPDRSYSAPGLEIGLRGTAGLSGFVSGFPELDPLLGPELAVTFDVATVPADARIDVKTLALQGAAGSTSVHGEVTLQPVSITADGRLLIPDMAALSGLLRRPVRGSVDTGYSAMWAPGDALRLKVDGALTDPRTGLEVADSLLGSPVAVSGQLAVAPDGALRADSVRVAGAALVLSGRVELPAGAATVSAEYKASVSDLAPLGIEDKARPGGRLETEGTVTGSLVDPGVEGFATAHTFAAGLPFDLMRLEYRVRNAVSRPAGDIVFRGTTAPLAELSGRFDFEKTDAAIRVEGLRVAARGTTVTGSLTVPPGDAAIAGRLQVTAADLAAWSDPAGFALGGRAEANIRLAEEDRRQTVRIDATGRNVKTGESTVAGRLELHLELVDPRGDGLIKASVAARRVLVGGGELAEVSLEASGTLSEAAVSMRAKGQLRDPLDLAATAQIRRPGTETEISLVGLDGTIAGSKIALTQPAQIRIGAVTELEALTLAVGEGRLEAEFRLSDERVAGQLDARSIPAGLFAPELPPEYAAVSFNMRARIGGRPDQLEGELELNAAGLAAGEIKDRPEGLSVALTGTLRANMLSVSGTLTGIDEVAAGARLSLPVRVSLRPAQAGVVRSQPMTGDLTYKGPVAPAWALAELDRHQLSGVADIAVRLSGTPDRPLIDGHIQLTNGRYENLDTGTVLSQIELFARPSQSAIFIDRATAYDGESGQVSASGQVEFGGPQNVALDLKANFDAAKLVRRDELTAVVSGEIAVSGTADDRLISGRLEVQEAEVRLAGGLPSEVVEIEVVERGAQAEIAVTVPPRPPSRTRLDLRIDMPKRVFVRGRGLDSEWGGSLLITGTTTTPRIEGELKPLRGRYDFAGKIFALREGSIRFIGERDINPALDLSAELKQTDLTAIIRVRGTARRPEVTMESIPDLPQDEILSRVLFNKSTGRLSATEALRLSQAVATLSGGGGGITDFARKMLTLDVLQFSGGTDEEEGSAQAGKYISDKIFLGVKAGASAGSSTATVEIEITPRIKVEGTVGSSDKSEIGIKWKRDY